MVKKFLILIITYSIIFLNLVHAQERNDINKESSTIKYVITEPGVSIAVTKWGGEGIPLVFIPSWGATSHVFDHFAPNFTNNFAVYVIDIRGHGKSSRPTNGYDLDTLTKDILTVLDSLNLEKVTLLGLSRSASIVSHFAVKYPDRINKLLYLSGPIDRAFARDFVNKPDIQQIFNNFNIFTDCLATKCDLMARYSLEPLLPANWIDSRPDTIGFEWRNNDPTPPYSKISVPALAFWHTPLTELELTNEYEEKCGQKVNGKIRKLFKEYTETLRLIDEHNLKFYNTELKNGKIVSVSNALYYPFVAQPKIVENEIREFLKN